VSDLLEAAARQLRGQAAGEPRPDDQTLGRVMATLRKRRRRRRIVVVLVAQLALATLGLGAWAAASGRLPALLAFVHLRGRPPARSVSAPERRHPPQPGKNGPVPAAPHAVEATSPRTASNGTDPVVPQPRPPRRLALPRSAPPAPDEDSLYRVAHEAHFVRHDWAAALAGWDRYLALPRLGRFAVEARYNRALALLRLGRSTAAAEALRPFAAGEYGAYRQPEARALLERLGRAPP
jgi:hypothetical protein